MTDDAPAPSEDKSNKKLALGLGVSLGALASAYVIAKKLGLLGDED